ncbi:MANSC domain-containing protein 1 isoform 2-T2 [Mantella aurantiaca]
MFAFTPHLVCTLLLHTLFSADTAAPGSSGCVPQEIPNMTIDVSNAVAKGARFTDPIKAASAEECVSACCSKLNGDRTCNLVLYNTNSNGVQNCYLFFCPKPESCPMSPSPGVLSYSLWTEKEKSNPDLTEEDLLEIPKSKNNGRVQNTLGKKSSPAVHGTVSAKSEFDEALSQRDKQSSPSDVHSQSKSSDVKHLTEDKADTPDHITTQLLHLANDIDKQLEKIEANSKEAKASVSVKLSVSPTDEKPLVKSIMSSRHKDLQNLSSDTKDTKSNKDIRKKPETVEDHYPTPKLITSPPPVRTSHQISIAAKHPTPSTKTTTILSTTPSKESKVAKKAPISGTKSTKILLSHNSANSSSTAATVKNMQVDYPLIPTQVPSISVVQAKSTLPVTRHNPSRTSLFKAAKSTLKDGSHPFTNKAVQEADRSVPELTSLEHQDTPSHAGDTKNAPQNLDATLDDRNKSGLVAALVFGVMFLVLVIGLVSHKVSEARRRHQYTKLDYLINGMYVDT